MTSICEREMFYSVLLVISSFLCSVITYGPVFSFGVLLPELYQYFGESVARTSLAGSLMVGVLDIAGIITNLIVVRFGCRWTIIFGLLTTSATLSFSTITTDIYQFIFVYGFIGGFGICLIYVSLQKSVAYHFETKRTLALDIVICGSGIGGFIFAPLSQYLVLKYNWKYAMYITSVIILSVGLPSSYVQPSDVSRPKNKRRCRRSRLLASSIMVGIGLPLGLSTSELGPRKEPRTPVLDIPPNLRNCAVFKLQNDDVETFRKEKKYSSSWKEFVKERILLFQNYKFVIFCAGNTIAFVGWNVPLFYITDYTISLRLQQSKGAFLVSCIGISSVMGRLIFGSLSDRRIISNIILYITSLGTIGVTSLILPSCKSYPFLLTIMLSYGVGLGGLFALTPVVLCGIVGEERLNGSLGLVSTLRGLSTICGPPLAGFIFRETDNYGPAFYTSSVFLIVGALVTSTVFIYSRRLRVSKMYPVCRHGCSY